MLEGKKLSDITMNFDLDSCYSHYQSFFSTVCTFPDKGHCPGFLLLLCGLAGRSNSVASFLHGQAKTNSYNKQLVIPKLDLFIYTGMSLLCYPACGPFTFLTRRVQPNLGFYWTLSTDSETVSSALSSCRTL